MSGAARIAWVESRMALLARIRARFASERPLDGLTIGVSLHLEPKTAALLNTLVAGGARVRATGNLGTTQEDVVAALNAGDGRIEAFGARDDTPERHAEHLERVLDARPDLLLDNGGDLAAGAVALGLTPRGGTEETTSGADRLRRDFAGRVPFPILVINDSPLKQIVENKHGVGQSVMEAFLRITNLQPQGKRLAVFGYGWCGRGIAHYARALGAAVSVVEPDEIKALEAALDGFAVRDPDEAAEVGNVFVTATGAPGVVPLALMERMPDGAVLANAGHVDWEIDVAALRARAASVETLDHAIERFVLDSGRTLIVLAGGRMVNLAGLNPKGNSIESMDLGFALQALSLERVALRAEALAHGPHPVPDDIDRRVAAAMVAQLMGRPSPGPL